MAVLSSLKLWCAWLCLGVFVSSLAFSYIRENIQVFDIEIAKYSHEVTSITECQQWTFKM